MFTKSEITLYAWRSQEQYWQFKARMAKDGESDYTDYEDDNEETVNDTVMSDSEVDVEKIYAALEKKQAPKQPKKKPAKKRDYSSKVPRGLPDKFYNKDGEIDLRQVTGQEAYRYFAAIGIPLPVIKRF